MLDRLLDASEHFRHGTFGKAGNFKVRGSANAVFGPDPAHMRRGDATRPSAAKPFQQFKFDGAPDGLRELKGQCGRSRAGETVR